MGTSTSFPLANCGGVTTPGICSVEKEAGKQGTNVVVPRQMRRKSLVSTGIPLFSACCQPQGCAEHCCAPVGVAQRRPWIWPSFSVSYNLFCELRGLHLKAVVPAPSALISRLFKTRAALVVRNLCIISRLRLFSC